ncbi:MAG: hypothetical protein ACRDWY_16045 [Actinomycetes bacterium]
MRQLRVTRRPPARRVETRASEETVPTARERPASDVTSTDTLQQIDEVLAED